MITPDLLAIALLVTSQTHPFKISPSASACQATLDRFEKHVPFLQLWKDFVEYEWENSFSIIILFQLVHKNQIITTNSNGLKSKHTPKGTPRLKDLMWSSTHVWVRLLLLLCCIYRCKCDSFVLVLRLNIHELRISAWNKDWSVGHLALFLELSVSCSTSDVWMGGPHIPDVFTSQADIFLPISNSVFIHHGM